MFSDSQKRVLLLIVCFALLLGYVISNVHIQRPNLFGTLPWLHVADNRIVNENGRLVILKGVAIEDQEQIAYLHRFNETDMVELVQNWHVNIIRVPVFPDLWQSNPHYVEDFLDPIVNWGLKYGIYILIGWHSHGNPLTGHTDKSWWDNSPPFHGNPFNPNLTLAINFWSLVAEQYKNDPWVIYSIFDEPSYITWNDWKPLAEQLVDVVHSHNSRALILVSGVSWAEDLRGVKQNPVLKQNVVYEVHPYPGMTKNFGSWDQYFGYLSNDYPLFAGEWGFQQANNDTSVNATAQTYGNPLLAYMSAKNMSWTAWCWSRYWSPTMLTQSGYIPTEFGQLVKNALTVTTQTSATKAPITNHSIATISSTSIALFNQPSSNTSCAIIWLRVYKMVVNSLFTVIFHCSERNNLRLSIWTEAISK